MTPLFRKARGYSLALVNRAKTRKMRNAAAKSLRQFAAQHKLHLGCGTVRLEGWINIDFDSSNEKADIYWDLRQGLLVPDSTCALIFCEHFLEHLSVEYGLAFLRECHRALQPGGALRVAMPSLDDLIDKSFRGTWREQDWLTWPEHQFIQSRAEMLNISFRGWGHQWLYDREELHRRLKEAGFTMVKDVSWGESDFEQLKNRETRADSLLICEAQK